MFSFRTDEMDDSTVVLGSTDDRSPPLDNEAVEWRKPIKIRLSLIEFPAVHPELTSVVPKVHQGESVPLQRL
jgi:hypothetical protein